MSREIISRYDSDIANGGTFYTDANGRQIMTRKYVILVRLIAASLNFLLT